MPEIKIRDVSFSSTYSEIHKACFSSGWNEATMRQLLLMSGSLGLIAYEQGKAAGMIMYTYSPDQADIVTLAVLPDYRGLHVSDALLKSSFAILSDRGIQEVFLEVAVDNSHALALYDRQGFKKVGVRRGYYVRGDVKTDALVMRADLRFLTD